MFINLFPAFRIEKVALHSHFSLESNIIEPKYKAPFIESLTRLFSIVILYGISKIWFDSENALMKICSFSSDKSGCLQNLNGISVTSLS